MLAGLVKGVACQHNLCTMIAGAFDFDARREAWHDDNRSYTEPAGVVGDALCMIARRDSKDALRARGGREARECVECAAFFERRSELVILELDDHLRAGNIRQRARQAAWRAQHAICNQCGSGADRFDGDQDGPPARRA